jgi:hypothetical protein
LNSVGIHKSRQAYNGSRTDKETVTPVLYEQCTTCTLIYHPPLLILTGT